MYLTKKTILVSRIYKELSKVISKITNNQILKRAKLEQTPHIEDIWATNMNNEKILNILMHEGNVS